MIKKIESGPFFLMVDDSVEIQIENLLLDEPDYIGLRISIQGGGCSGFSYNFSFCEESSDMDLLFKLNRTLIVIDTMSIQYLNNSEVRYDNSLLGSRFVIENPVAKTTCGCGSSFSV